MSNAIELPETGEMHRILIVEDDIDFAASMREIIESRGDCLTRIAGTPEEAQQVQASFSPEVVLIDVRLGKSDGTELLTEFACHATVPTCIMITGYASTDSAIDALHAGAYDYLTKPVAPETLFVTLNRCFERTRLEKERADALYSFESRNRELEQVNQRLHRVVECMGALTSSSSVAGLCHLLLEKVAQNMGAEGGSVYICEGDQLLLAHSLDPGHAPAVIPMPLNTSSVLGRVVDKGEAVLVSDAASSEGLMLSGWSGYRDQSLLALPLIGQDNDIVGVLSLHTKQQPPFTPQDCDIGRILLAASSETLRAVKALEDLQKSESMLKLIIDSEPECVTVMDRERNLLQMNPAGLAILEADSIDELAGNCVNSCVNPEYRDAFTDLSNRVCQGENGTLEFKITGLKGTMRWLETHQVPLRDANQEIIGLLGVTRDITARKQLVEKTRQQELQLMQANKISALGTLVAGVAHEINNPNQTIQINSGLMVEVWRDVENILDQHAESHGDFCLCGLPYSEVRAGYSDVVRDIKDGAEQIKIVIDRLRTFARPVGGIHEKARGERIQINDAVETSLALLGHAVRKGTDNFTKNLAEDLPGIPGNRQHVQQIVINLVLNSLESLEEKSAAVQIETRFDTEHSCILLIIHDEGSGIQAEDLERIMEPFYTTKRDTGGTGLGLSITHTLVSELGATLQLESEPGKGTRATVSFPVAMH